jgi:hypothetical protein
LRSARLWYVYGACLSSLGHLSISPCGPCIDFYYPTTHTHTHTPICNGAIYTWGWIRGGQQIFTRCCGCWHLLPDLLLLTAEPTFSPSWTKLFFFFFFVKWNRKKWRDITRIGMSSCNSYRPTHVHVPTSYQEKLDNQNFRLFDITEEEEEVKQNSQRTLKSLEKTKLKNFPSFFPLY